MSDSRRALPDDFAADAMSFSLFVIAALSIINAAAIFFSFFPYVPLLLNFPMAFLIEFAKVKTSEGGKLSLASAFAIILLAAELAIIEFVIGTAASLCFIVSQAYEGLVNVEALIGAYLFLWLAIRRIPLLRQKTGRFIQKDMLAVCVIISAGILFLDVYYSFRFLLLLNACFLAALIAYRIAIFRVRLHLKSRWTGVMRISMFVALAALLLSLAFSAQRLSMLGSYRVFVKEVGYDLRHSKRAEINSSGFRGPEIGVEAPPGTFRIAALGDSTTYGFLLPESRSYGRILETKLNALSDDAAIQVINAGVPSYDLSHIKHRYINKVAQYKPDIVLLMSGPNDRDYLEGDSFERILGEILLETQKNDSRLALLSYPFLSKSDINKKHVERLKAFAEEKHILFIDLFQPLSKRQECFFVDTHPKACGQAIMAEIVLDELIKSGFVPARNSREAK